MNLKEAKYNSLSFSCINHICMDFNRGFLSLAKWVFENFVMYVFTETWVPRIAGIEWKQMNLRKKDFINKNVPKMIGKTYHKIFTKQR